MHFQQRNSPSKRSFYGGSGGGQFAAAAASKFSYGKALKVNHINASGIMIPAFSENWNFSHCLQSFIYWTDLPFAHLIRWSNQSILAAVYWMHENNIPCQLKAINASIHLRLAMCVGPKVKVEFPQLPYINLQHKSECSVSHQAGECCTAAIIIKILGHEFYDK